MSRPPQSSRRRTRWLSLVAFPVVAIGLLSNNLAPARADLFSDDNDYQVCADRLKTAKVSTEEAATACARAFRPQDLASCVTTLTTDKFAVADALSACKQVRRPRDLATCVVDIRRDVANAVAGEVLDSCRRSLLPKRYRDCVTGLVASLKVEPGKALDRCIDASDRPLDLQPDFIPIGQPVPTSPSTTPAPTVPDAGTPGTLAPSRSTP